MTPIITNNPFSLARCVWAAILAAVLLTMTGSAALAGAHAPFAARAGLAQAQAAAQVWAQDAALVYLENDEDITEAGSAQRWGYLFFSPSLQSARSYSIRDARIVLAETLEMKFDAPALSSGWLDSDAALLAAESHGGSSFRRANGARVSSMLLSRGAFQPGAPDVTTWTVVYTSPGAPSLFIVVDAAQGRVFRSWRG